MTLLSDVIAIKALGIRIAFFIEHVVIAGVSAA